MAAEQDRIQRSLWPAFASALVNPKFTCSHMCDRSTSPIRQGPDADGGVTGDDAVLVNPPTNYASGTNDHIASNGCARKDDRIHSDEHVVFDLDAAEKSTISFRRGSGSNQHSCQRI